MDKKERQHKTGLGKKVALLIFFTTFIVLAIGLSVEYGLSFKLLHRTIGENHVEIANLLAVHIRESIEEKIGEIMALSGSPLWRKQILEANEKAGRMAQDERARYFARMDSAWPGTSWDDPSISEFAGNYLSIRLKALCDDTKDIREFLVSDKYGGIVASSNKTTDFYQADEEWWQKAYADGKGGIFISNIQYDESSDVVGITFALPIRVDSGEIIGTCKVIIDTKSYFAPLASFDIGKSGHAVLTDSEGLVIFHSGVIPVEQKLLNYSELPKGVRSGHLIMYDSPFHRGKRQFIAFSDVFPSPVFGNDINWKVFVSQDSSEVFGPLNTLMLQMISVALLLIAILMPIGRAFGGYFVRPIHELHMATDRILEGDWDYSIDIKTNDEIEQFADAFKEMIVNIKTKQDDLIKAKNELEELSRGLEKRVEARTKDLSDAQAAGLNLLEDIQEEKKKVEKYSKDLESALRIKADFTSMVSHELRTPLTAIKEGISLVLDGTTGPLNKNQEEFLSIAKRNVDRLARLINDVLDLQKLESGKMVFSLAPEDINGAVREVYDTMITMARDKALDIVLELSEGIPKVVFDRDKIIQVLANLVNNAVKLTDKGRITVRTEIKDGLLRVTVKDEGPGIRKEDLPKLFRRFEQLEKGTERRTGGTGLGLAISKDIIERHGGTIWAESEFGQGASFIFTIPIVERKESYGEDRTYNG
ncbi:MAG TPA: ATP-binding protein [Candidatus Omnitrophota bacterium]|nr:HAMP domain-containing protein [Candidatus Omnitrophota bacterium]HOX09509.1 ATP-binding protein [Candidatus Omnitrophota bacterium]HPN66718.1 ATP-binding protein [Candidatus Omnitrophota bacterium]HRZ66750.1 ATP-binding protein [Candidatus Omnitrophota bacterium]